MVVEADSRAFVLVKLIVKIGPSQESQIRSPSHRSIDGKSFRFVARTFCKTAQADISDPPVRDGVVRFEHGPARVSVPDKKPGLVLLGLVQRLDRVFPGPVPRQTI